MRSTNRGVRTLADQMVKDFCDRAQTFDYVNIQLEHGTLGKKVSDINRRFAMIARSAPALSVTFHTVLSQEPFNLGFFASNLVRLKFRAALNVVLSFIASCLMVRPMYGLLRRLQRTKPVSVIVHTRRDMRLMRYVNRLDAVYDHPLAFISPETAQELRVRAANGRIPGLRALPPGAKVVGVFGFLTEYKGVDTAIKAMHLLPPDFHLFVFGGLHPNEIKKGDKLHPYLAQLLKEANVGVTALDRLGKASVVLQIDGSNPTLLTDHPKDIGDRIHFLGPQTDEGLASSMAICDHVVLPYFEVGQSSSGVLSLAVEMGSRVIAARNHAFMQFARYHPDTIELFEVGNYLELAEKIMAEPAYPAVARVLKYSVTTNVQTYVAAHSKHPATANGLSQVQKRRELVLTSR